MLIYIENEMPINTPKFTYARNESPVVVGSSPISHPKPDKESPLHKT